MLSPPGENIMGMGSFAVGNFVIEYDDLKKICPDAIASIENEKFFDITGWGSIGQWLAWDDPDQFKDEIYFMNENMDNDEVENYVEIYDKHITNLKNVFNKHTGLNLYFDYYDEEGGDRYDNPGDKDGCIFCVDGMVQLTPAGEKFKDIISERRWTQYG
jgi:hypothetical protein